MKHTLSLKRPTRRHLQKPDRKCPHADLCVRMRVILKLASGLSRNAAAREVGCAPSTAVRIAARFMREGEASLLDHRSENGARKVDDDVRGHVREILAGRPNDHGFERPTWTPEILRAVIANVVGVLPSIAHVVVFTGEVDIHLNPKTGPGWMLSGTQRRVLTPDKKRSAASRGPTSRCTTDGSTSRATARPAGSS